ncbi:MAG: tetratricopeptide repeat protein [Candidatus Ozemobacteraceae bacterium]
MRKIGLWVLFGWLTAVPLGALTLDALPDYQDAGMKMYVRGTQKLQAQDFVGAADDLRQAVRARPDLAEAFHNLGFALEKTGDLKGAAAAYERALGIKPTYASAMNNLGFLLATTEVDPQRAVQLCLRAVELEPSSANFRDSLGWACYKAGRIDDAVLHFKSAMKIDPTLPKPYFNLGLCEFNRKNFIEAARAFSNAIQINPGFIKAYIPLGVCYENMKQTNRALYVYQQALTKVPDGSPVKKHLNRQIKKITKDSKSYYFSNVKQIQASTKLADFIKRKGRTGNLMGSTGSKTTDSLDSNSFTPVAAVPGASENSGGDISGGMGFDAGFDPGRSTSLSAAAPSYSLSTVGNPALSPRSENDLTVAQERSLEKRYALCQSYLDRGLTQEAISDLQKIVNLGGSSNIARQARNLLLRARKVTDDRDRERAETHLSMGKDFIRSAKYDLADAEIRKAISLAPDNAEAHKDLALLHYNQGRLKEAYEESKRAIALDRTMKEAYVVLASLYSKKGRTEDAVRTLKRMRDLGGDRDAVDDLAERMMSSLSAGS